MHVLGRSARAFSSSASRFARQARRPRNAPDFDLPQLQRTGLLLDSPATKDDWHQDDLPAGRLSNLDEEVFEEDMDFKGTRAAVKESVDREVDADEANDVGSSSAGYRFLQQHQEVLEVLRVIENDMPNLVAFRQPFVPPTSANPMIVRTISYGGQKHPVRNKRVVTVPVSRLPLLSVDAVRTFIHLAGPRWSSDPPKDSGFGTDEVEAHGHFGYIKISCEDFPRAGMNLKWASDVLDQLVLQSNVTASKFSDLPIDQRHIISRNLKKKRGSSVSSRPPSIRDFPEDWLPQSAVQVESLDSLDLDEGHLPKS